MQNRWIYVIIAVIMISIAALIFPILMDGGDDILRDNQTDTGTNVVNTGGSGTMTLSQPLYDDSVDWVTTMTSNVGSDTAVASTYNSTTNLLTMTGLVGTPMAAGTRNITCTYQYDNTDGFTGLKNVVEVAPLIAWVGIIFSFGFFSLMGLRTLRRMD